MCGIAGIINSPLSVAELHMIGQKMVQQLNHRGPDAEGFYITNEKNLGLGHKRLSILDTTSLANQPMFYGHNRYTIVFNGEKYLHFIKVFSFSRRTVFTASFSNSDILIIKNISE